MPNPRYREENGEEGLDLYLLKEVLGNINKLSAQVTEVRTDLHRHALVVEAIKTEFVVFRTNLEAITKLVRDGNGQPSLVTRMAVLENDMRAQQERQEREEHEASESQRLSMGNRAQIWAAIIGAVISGLIGIFALFK